MICLYLLDGCRMSFEFSDCAGRRKRRKPSASVQFENENHVTPT